MSNPGDYRPIQASFEPSPRLPGAGNGDFPAGTADPRVPLSNLSSVRARMDSLQQFLSLSVNNNTLIGKDQMAMVSAEIASAIQQIIVNGAALLAASQSPSVSSQNHEIARIPPEIANSVTINNETFHVNHSSLGQIRSQSAMVLNTESNSISIGAGQSEVDPKIEVIDEEMRDETASDDCEIIELDAVELLAEHVHFCEICGKGFKRDANLRMHMRAHGNQFKTPEALANPDKTSSRRKMRFSCPFVGCNRNKQHKKFRPLKSAICVKNHFKRSHCPKMYSCNRCNKKSFSVLADLKSHLKHCGESKWKCSCGTSFSRKDKLFGHMALFEGHMPAVVEEDEKGKEAVVMVEDEDEDGAVKEPQTNFSDNRLFDELLEGFGSIDNYCLQDILGSGNGVGAGMSEFRSF